MWYLVIGAVIGIYLLINLSLGSLFSGFVASYVVQPILWIALAVFVLRLPRERPAAKASLKNALIATAAMAGVLHVILLVTGGFMVGFGRSPYAHDPSGIIINIIYVGSALVGLELSRAYLVNRLSRKHATLIIAIVALLYTSVAISRSAWTGIGGGGEATVTFLGETWLPLLAKNLLATFLAFLGGPLPAIAYMGVLAAFEWLSPVLPDLTPMMAALFGTVAPIVGFAFIQYGLVPYYVRVRTRGQREKKASSSLPIGWIAAGIVSVALIWFSLGLFSVWPNVIYSGSMSPALEVGDMVIVTETSPDEINIGDVIAYRGGRNTVVHRVIAIADEESGRVFITQGDANRNPDSDPVLPNQIVGRVILTVPKVGWAAVGVKSWLFSSG